MWSNLWISVVESVDKLRETVDKLTKNCETPDSFFPDEFFLIGFLLIYLDY